MVKRNRETRCDDIGDGGDLLLQGVETNMYALYFAREENVRLGTFPRCSLPAFILSPPRTHVYFIAIKIPVPGLSFGDGKMAHQEMRSATDKRNGTKLRAGDISLVINRINHGE